MSEKTPTELGYETQDVRPGKLLVAALALAALVIVSVAAMTLMFGVLYDWREPSVNAVGPLSDLSEKPEGPILQVDPPRELIEMRARDAVETTSYGWVNRESGTVRIPIEQAMRLVVERHGK